MTAPECTRLSTIEVSSQPHRKHLLGRTLTAFERVVARLRWPLHTVLVRLDLRTMAAFSLPFTLYVLTLAPTIYNLDSAELTTAAYTGGLMRATGYPLYLVLGHFWSRLPLGDVGYRMNLFSAFMGALTIALSDRILRRWRVGPWAAFGALGLLATAPFFWGMSLVAEVYTLQTALMASLILALLRWGESPTPRRLALVGLLGGLSMGHHMSTVLLVPGSLLYVMTTAPRLFFSRRSLLAVALGTLAGLSIYLYLPLRYAAQPVFNYAGTYDETLNFIPVNLQTFAGLWWLVTGKAFGNQMLAYHGLDLLREIGHFAAQLGQAFFAVGIGPGVLGLILLFRRSWREASMLALMFCFSAAFYVDYRVIDKATMFLPAYVIWALWVGIGFQELLIWLRGASNAQGDLKTMQVMRTAMVAIVLLAVAWNWRLVDLSHDWSARQRAEAVLRNVRPNALVFGWWDMAPVLQYLQLVEGQRTDVRVINRFLIAPADLNRLIEKEVRYRPIYIDSPPNDLLMTMEAEPVGPVFRLVPQ